MEGLAAVFIALSLLLSPLTGNHNTAANSARHEAMTLSQGENSNSNDHTGTVETSTGGGGSKGALTIRDNDNSDCPYKYPDINSKDYCECVVGRSDNFICNYDCSCSLGGVLCISSSCTLSTGAILLIVGVAVGGVALCVGCSALCIVLARRRRNNYKVIGAGHHHQHHQRP